MEAMADSPQTQSSPTSIAALIEQRASRTPQAVSILAPGRAPLSYENLHSQIRSTVAALNGFGIGRNDRVALVLPNGPELAVAFLAVAAGATSAPLNPTYRAEEFDFYLSDLNAKALVVLAGAESPAVAVAGQKGIRAGAPPWSTSRARRNEVASRWRAG
jgi:acyl-CoA synthetase (AMP-forming)/AMP-acid ligase II